MEKLSKSELKEKIIKSVDKDYAVAFLKSLVRLPSAFGEATLAQELVLEKLTHCGFDVDKFMPNFTNITELDDYCPLPENVVLSSGAYNLVGKKSSSKKTAKSLMLFSHIDTEPRKDDKELSGLVDGDKFYGLGAADAKSGIAMMLLAAQYILKEVELDGDLTLMSVLGKAGGSAGTLTAIKRGYQADASIYIHPAETGHSFHEIKCYSMGVIDFRLTVPGKKGHPIDELDESEENAVIRGAKLINGLIEWNKERQSRLLFEKGDFKGQPKTKLNIGKAQGGTYAGSDPISFMVDCRLYFAHDESIESVLNDLKKAISIMFTDDPFIRDNPIILEKLYLRASPGYIEEDHDIIKKLINNIDQVKGKQDYIYQYHGASDIRLPIIYGNTPCVGIGPQAGGFYGAEWTDWVSIEDYLNGINILIGTIIDWCIED